VLTVARSAFVKGEAKEMRDREKKLSEEVALKRCEAALTVWPELGPPPAVRGPGAPCCVAHPHRAHIAAPARIRRWDNEQPGPFLGVDLGFSPSHHGAEETGKQFSFDHAAWPGCGRIVRCTRCLLSLAGKARSRSARFSTWGAARDLKAADAEAANM
jgi:hypothetical protein